MKKKSKKDTWNELTNILHIIYEEHGMLVRLSKDADDLEEAFIHIEKLWEEQFKKIDRINFILLGEAPRYGSDRSYFYNADSKYTAFFRHEISPSVISTSLSKPVLFHHLRESGFIILDLFPFAFNDNTAISYRPNFRSKKKVKKLFERTYEYYLEPKLKKIQGKSHKNTVFCLRYKKHKGMLEKVIQTRLNEVGFSFDISDIGCVGSSNMPIDTKELENKCGSL